MMNFESLSTSQKARASLHRDVRAICSETCHFLGLEVTKPAMEIIAELVFKKLTVYGLDLEAFAKHAKRSTINSDDVKLLARRNPSLKSHLIKITPNTAATKEKRRKTTIPKQTDTPSASKDSLPKTNDQFTKNKEDDSTKTKELDKENILDDILEDNIVENMIVDKDNTIDLTCD